MGLVQSNKKKKVTIDRGPSIQPAKTFTMDQLPKKNEQQANEPPKIPMPNFIYEPKPTTLKIDTRLRDQINALSLIGFGDTQKEAIEIMIQNVLDSMTEDERRKFNIQYQVLEDKTIKQAKKSKTK